MTVSNSTGTNQASEDELDTVFYKYLGGTPDSDEYQDWLELKQDIQVLIRTEKLKLLAEVRERVIGEDDEPRNILEHSRRNFLRAEQRTALAKLEAEL